MSTRSCATLVCTAVFVASLVSGSDDGLGSTDAGTTTAASSTSEGTTAAAVVTADAAARGPLLHPGLSDRVASRLGSAIPVAQQHLRDNPPCQALFASLGADGVAKLDSSSYYPAGVKEERKYCRGSRVALARVGSPAVRLCRSFGRLSDQRAAIILIHEALHFAGQTEYPADSRAPDGTSITRMVMESCRLF